MVKQLRSLVLLSAASLLLAACGALNAFIPDQEVPGGVLGFGEDGQVVEFGAEASPSGLLTPSAMGDSTTFVAQIQLGHEFDPPEEDIPNWVQIGGIEETITLDDEVQVVFVGDFTIDTLPEEYSSFTLVGLQLSAQLSISGSVVYSSPTYGAGALSVVFGGAQVVASGAGTTTVSYTTVSNLPRIDVDLSQSKPLLQQLTNLVKHGGGLVADITLTAELFEPGLPSDAAILVTVKSLGATIEF